MVRLLFTLLAGCLMFFASGRPVLHAETIIADMSDRVIRINSNFTGSQIVVFGMIERDVNTVSRGEPYDLVIVVRGWDQKLVSRRKERVVGVWINTEKRSYDNAPNFYVMASTRKLDDIAHPALLSKLQIGTEYLLLPSTGRDLTKFPTYDPFREAALRLKRNKGLYRDDLSSITFLNDTLFRSRVDIPANVEVGRYDVTVYLFRGGALLHSQTQPLNVAKSGFEQVTYSLAQKQSFVYGLLCVLLAVFTGWFAGVVFRKN
nr:TIGR02186 family protein [uncultured Cohaesibacter sp.]